MNPILLSPKIESDKSPAEQLQQMKSYLFQFKEQIELLLMNIDSDNMSEEYKQEMSRKFADSKSMSEILQTAGMIKMSVKDVSDTVASLSVTVGGIYAEVHGANGILARLDIDESGISQSVKKGTQYSGIKLSASGVKISATGTFEVDTTHFTLDAQGNLWCNSGTFEGTVNADYGRIGHLGISSYALTYDNKDVLAYSTAVCDLGDPSNTFTRIFGSEIDLNGDCYFDKIEGKSIEWKDIDSVIGTGAYVLCEK